MLSHKTFSPPLLNLIFYLDHVFRQLFFFFRSSFLADKETNNNLLCQGAPCSLPALTAEFPTSSHVPVFWPLHFTVYKAKHDRSLMHGLFVTNNEHQFTIYSIFLEEIGFWFVFLIRLPLYILFLHNPILQSSLFPLNWSGFLEHDHLEQLKRMLIHLLSLDQPLSGRSDADTHLASGWRLEPHKRGVGSLALDICQ